MLGPSHWLHEICLPKRVFHHFRPGLYPLQRTPYPVNKEASGATTTQKTILQFRKKQFTEKVLPNDYLRSMIYFQFSDVASLATIPRWI
jgi:hypothetical protein